MVERTLVLIKTDGVAKKKVGEIIRRFEEKGLSLVQLKLLTISDQLSDQHYQEHVQKPFYPALCAFITSGPVVAMILEGTNAISVVRRMVGATDSSEADPGTIRGDLALSKAENMVHASDSLESASREMTLFFPQ